MRCGAIDGSSVSMLTLASLLVVGCATPLPAIDSTSSSTSAASDSSTSASTSSSLDSTEAGLDSSSEGSGSSGSPSDCGNGLLDDGEACDDGELNGSYGYCAVECDGPGSRCGDGVVNGDEQCDDGLNDGSYEGCNPGCGALGPLCGDGQQHAFEECDDGNAVLGDGCNPTCLVSGTLRWAVTYPLSGAIIGIETLNDGNVAVGVESDDPFVLAFAADDGSVTWSKLAEASGYVAFSADAMRADGNEVILVGIGHLDAPGWNNEGWVGRVSQIVPMADNWIESDIFIRDVAVDPLGLVLVGTASNGAGGWVGQIRHPDWVEELEATYFSTMSSIVRQPSGSLVVVGSQQADPKFSTGTVRSYSVTGDLEWEHVPFDGMTAHFGPAYVRSMPDGGVALAGTHGPNFGQQLGFIARLDANGQLVWLQAPSPQTWTDAAVDESRADIVVVGSSMLVRHDPDGNLLWEQSASELDIEPAPTFSAVTLATDGTLYVAGTLQGSVWLGCFEP